MAKRKASVATASTSSGSVAASAASTLKPTRTQVGIVNQEHSILNDSEVAHDTEPPAPKKKKGAAKKALKLISTDGISGDHDGVGAVAGKAAITSNKLTSRESTSKKRKIGDESAVESGKELHNNKSEHDCSADTAALPPAKKQKHASPKTQASKRRVKAATTARPGSTELESHPQIQHLAQPVPLSATVAAKVKRVRDFIATSPPPAPVLDRRSTQPAQVHVPELSLKAAIMRMQVDYTTSDSDDDPYLDAEDIIADRFTQSIRQCPDQQWVTIDLSLPFALEKTIHDKVAGHGLEGVNLLEVELEMYERQLQKLKQQHEEPGLVDAGGVSGPVEFKSFFQDAWRKAEDDANAASEVRARESNERLLMNTCSFGMEEELPAKGVCPAAPVVLI